LRLTALRFNTLPCCFLFRLTARVLFGALTFFLLSMQARSLFFLGLPAGFRFGALLRFGFRLTACFFFDTQARGLLFFKAACFFSLPTGFGFGLFARGILFRFSSRFRIEPLLLFSRPPALFFRCSLLLFGQQARGCCRGGGFCCGFAFLTTCRFRTGKLARLFIGLLLAALLTSLLARLAALRRRRDDLAAQRC
jgi:hypothetical protein